MKQSRIKVTYLAVDSDGNKPLITASTFEDLRLALDDYYGVGVSESVKCLGFTPYQTKYPEEYEGYYEYEFPWEGEILKDKVKVYCLEYYPYTKYEVEI